MKEIVKHYIIILSILLVPVIVHSQILTNNSNGKISNNGTIKFNSASGKISNNATQPVSSNKFLNQGIIDFSGTVLNPVFDGINRLGVVGERIPGTIKYSANSGTVSVLGTGSETYYTSLGLEGNSTKYIPDEVYIGGTYSISGGDRYYNGTFYYDGTIPQIITGENGTSGGSNIYNNLYLLGGGTKTVQTGSSNYVYLDGSIISESGTNLYLYGTLIAGRAVNPPNSSITGNVIIDGNNSASDAAFYINNTNCNFNGNVGLQNGGSDDALLVLNGAGSVTFSSTTTVNSTGGSINVSTGAGKILITNTGSLILQNSNDARLNLSNGTTLDIFGLYVNNYNSGYTNVNYSNSTVKYCNPATPQSIVATTVGNPYYNLIIEGTGLKSATGNIYINGDLSVSNSNIDMYCSGNDYTLNMTNPLKLVTYSSNEEVIGRFRRIISSSASGYRFNNINTTITFTSGVSTYPSEMIFSVRPGVNPLNYNSNTDINRKIFVYYPAPTSQFTATLKLQYKDEELYSSSYYQSSLRLFEATSSDVEKLSTGEVRTVLPSIGTGSVGSILLPGVKSGSGILPNGSDIYVSSNDLLIRCGPSVFNAIANGRWSNPATWDEGTEPTGADDVVIDGFTVHAGFIRSSDNYNVNEQYPTSLAQNITIGSSVNSALLFGSSDITGVAPLFRLSTNGLILNYGIYSPGFVPTDTENIGSTQFGGLVIYYGSSLKTNNLTNDGTLSNGGYVEIGD